MRKKAEETSVVEMVDMAELLKAEGLDLLVPCIPKFTVIPTGISNFDNYILGTGGIPRGGKITQFWGSKSAGKSTLIYRVIAQSQRQQPTKYAVLFDSEYSYNPERARDAGVDTDRLQVIQGNIAEEVYGKILKYVRSGACSLVVLDSIANLITSSQSFDSPVAEEEPADKPKAKGKPKSKPSGPKTIPGEFAKMTKAFLRDLCRYGNQHDVGLLFANQVTKLIGVLYGSNEDYPGGEAFKHNLQLSCRVSKVCFLYDDQKEPIGIRVKVKVDKNKLAVERETDDTSHLDLYFKDGITKSLTYSLYDDAVYAGVFTGQGWITVTDPQTGAEITKIQGRDNLRSKLVNEPEFAESVRQYIRAASALVSPKAA